MGKLTSSLFILLLLMLVTVPQELSAQSFLSRIFQSSKLQNRKKIVQHRRYHCGEMDAYNKKRAYKKNTVGKWKRMLSRRTVKPSERKPVAEREPVQKTSPPSRPNTTTTPKPENSSKAPPPKDTPVADKLPVPPKSPVPTPEAKKKAPGFNRDSLKKLTEDERRDTILQMQPEIVLTPLQFISDQDEFSVVNMDSFIQAMEYAQQGKIVLVEGHTDDLGSDAYNLDLSMKRAEKIRELLLSGGISDELISVIGYGERQPLVPNTSTENRSINRRIEFKIFSLPE